MSLFSIGHSTRSFEDLAALTKKWEVNTIADVRSFPGSKRYPHFNIESLRDTLPQKDINYLHFKGLGGRRKDKDPNGNFAGWTEDGFRYYASYAFNSNEFSESLQSLLAMSKNENIAMMCSEAVWWKCHRRIITDYAIANNVPVNHILSMTKCDMAKITPFSIIQKIPDQINKMLYPISR